MAEKVTMEDLDKTTRKMSALTDALRSQLFPHGKPDWMSKEQWAEIGGEEKEG